MAHRALDPARVARRRQRPADVGQQRADDAVLPRDRARSATGVRPRRPPRTTPLHPPVRRRPARDGGAGAHLPGLQRRPRQCPWLGHRDVDGHRTRARGARAARSPGARPGAHLPGDGVRRRRPCRAGGDRGRLQRGHRPDAPPVCDRCLRAVARGGQVADAAAVALRRPRCRHLGCAPGQRGGPDRGWTGDRAGRTGVHPESRRPGGRDRSGTPLPRAAHLRARAIGDGRPDLHALAERKTADLLPPVDELSDRPALRPRERGHRPRRRLPRTRLHGPGNPGCPGRLRRREAGGGRRHRRGW